MKAVFAIFKTYEQAEAAVSDLLQKGFDLSDMNVIVQDYIVKGRVNERRVNIAVTHMPLGLDKLVEGRLPVEVIDTGSVYAAGDQARIWADTAADAHSGEGLKGALIELGMNDTTASAFLDGIKGGGLLFWIIADDGRVQEAIHVLSGHKGIRVTANPG